MHFFGRIMTVEIFIIEKDDIFLGDFPCEEVKVNFISWNLFTVVYGFDSKVKWNILVWLLEPSYNSRYLISFGFIDIVKDKFFEDIIKLFCKKFHSVIFPIDTEDIASSKLAQILSCIVNHDINRNKFYGELFSIELDISDVESIFDRKVNISDIIMFEFTFNLF